MQPWITLTVNVGDADKDHRVDVSGSLRIGPANLTLPTINLDVGTAVNAVFAAFAAAKNLLAKL